MVQGNLGRAQDGFELQSSSTNDIGCLSGFGVGAEGFRSRMERLVKVRNRRSFCCASFLEFIDVLGDEREELANGRRHGWIWSG